MNTKGRRSKSEYERDSRRVSDLYLRGKLQVEIAEELNLSQPTVCRHLAELQDEWLATSINNFDEVKSRELARIDQLEREYWQAWQRSCENEETVVQKQVETAVGSRRKEATKTEKGQAGDPRFLTGIQWCIEQRLKIFGIYEATKIKVEGWQDEVVALLRSGQLLPDEVTAAYPDLAPQFFAQAGIKAYANPDSDD